MLSVIGKSGRESLPFDFVVVGGGPAGLSAAIRLKQIQPNASVAVLEKGSSCGSHNVSGCVLDPIALDELMPDWRKDKQAPIHTPARNYSCHLMICGGRRIRTPTPPSMRQNSASKAGPDTFILSLSQLCSYMAKRAETLGVEVLPGFGANEVLFTDKSKLRVAGVATKDVGVDKNGKHKKSFERGVEVTAPFTLFSEGCRGHLTQALLEHYNLTGTCPNVKPNFGTGKSPLPQTYALGLKEVWRVKPEKHHPGLVRNTVGWPSDSKTYAGSFEYHFGSNNLVFIGYAIGLDYSNPTIDPFAEFQKWKTSSHIRDLLDGGKCVQFAARTMTDGGIQAMPSSLAFPGGAFAGESAGLMTVARLKGVHTAMKSGILAAETVSDVLGSSKGWNRAVTNPDVWKRYEKEYNKRVQQSWIWDEMYKTRNVRPAFHQLGKFLGGRGFLPFLGFGAFDSYITRGKLPFTWGHGNVEDRARTLPVAKVSPKQYPKPDGKVVFDRTEAVALAKVEHIEDQPSHLLMHDKNKPLDVNKAVYGGIDQKYCPAGVYEYVTKKDSATGKTTTSLVMHPSNCVHCKTCVIKDPTGNITWTLPENGGGPHYTVA